MNCSRSSAYMPVSPLLALCFSVYKPVYLCLSRLRLEMEAGRPRLLQVRATSEALASSAATWKWRLGGRGYCKRPLWEACPVSGTPGREEVRNETRGIHGKSCLTSAHPPA